MTEKPFYTAEKPVNSLQASLSTCSAQNIFLFPTKEPIHRIKMEASQICNHWASR